MSGPIEIVLILAVVGYVLVRRMMGEAAQAKRMLLLPGVLVVIGLTQAGPALHSPAAVVFLLVSAALSVAIGALRGASVKISDRGGVAFVRYTWVTVVLWVVNLSVKFGANFVFAHIDPHAAALGNSLLVTLGLGILVEGLVVMAKVLRSGSQVIWTRDQAGNPQTRSPLMDNLRESVNGRPVGARTNRSGWDAAQRDRRY
ncbi:MAG TPA: DUF1453 domain-containing protein [Pseudonocardiaceae bacterium]